MANATPTKTSPSLVLEPTPSGRLRAADVPSSDHILASLCHISPLIGLVLWPMFFFPAVLCLFQPGKTAFLNDHAREALNGQISLILVLVLLTCSIIGIPLIPVVLVIYLVNLIRGTVIAADREFFRYPVTIRILPAPAI